MTVGSRFARPEAAFARASGRPGTPASVAAVLLPDPAAATRSLLWARSPVGAWFAPPPRPPCYSSQELKDKYVQIGGFGYPSVRRNSPLLEYLNKCDVGCALRSDDLLQVVSYPHCAAVPSVLPQLLRLPTAGHN